MGNRVLPIVLFILAQIASVTILTLWIVFSAITNRSAWWLIQGILLMVLIIVGASILFANWFKLKVLNKERINLISNVSHELLTPVASLRLYVETMLMRDIDKDKREEFLHLMEADVDRLSRLISTLLSSAKIELKKSMYSFERRDLSEMVRTFLEEQKLLRDRLELTLELEDPCFCMVDFPSFEMVAKNLIENALRYSNEEPAKLTISVEKKEKTACLTVKDEGQGVEPKYLKKIFKMFYRASKKPGGTGLGLFIVSGVMKAHKGKVWAKSEGLGKGTSIVLEFPLATPKKKP